ncbi:tripartite tricarboxylate transporter substrate binding protein [Cupriavidus sp. L7L]|uniref:Bug family tripartite tricarboxylate transporter substrate binding protein n=1 Tax=Cupriavidus sp. L7L TaxID=2546443 RepID=UPI001056C0ED|nr:tripartite tricarboxylate transporter substrate binding protein [Cupriavidus sp. L7L]TDF61955.1 tripartite tricarboxylate transporter substrate binding protein [Cupriavidus sp. L7L]
MATVRAYGIALLAVATLWSGSASAHDYPDHPVRLVVPYPPGGSTDLIARLYAEKLSKELGQAVVVDNRPGAATNIGSEAVARAKPDGYTILFGGGGPTINAIFGPMPSFDPLAAFAPISLIARVPFVVAANPKAPFSNIKEFLAAARSAPGKYSISSAQLNLYVELLKNRAGIRLLHIPYKGGAQAATDAIAGQVDSVYALVPVLLPHLQAGKLKALGITSNKRLEALPATPTFVENGVDYDITIWYGLLAPAGTPKPILNRLAAATQSIVVESDFVQKVNAVGAVAIASQPGELSAQMRAENATWQTVARTIPALLQSTANK